MTVAGEIQDHQERCLSHRISLRMLAEGEAGLPLPRWAAAEVAQATGAILAEAEAAGRAALRIMADDGRRATLAAAVETAEHDLRLDGERVRELARWALAPGSARSDGVPATSYPARAEHTEPYLPGRDFAHGHGWGLPPLSSARAPRATGVVGLLATAADRPVDWVNAGQALQRILLTASTCGAAVALHSQPVELPWLREFIRTQLSDGAYPHLVLRIGMVTQVAVSVRRDPDDVLFSSGGDRVSVDRG
jgi:hypothetical protein